MGKKNKKGKSSKPPLNTPPLDTLPLDTLLLDTHPLDTPPLDTQVVQSAPSVNSLPTVSDEEPYDDLKPKRHPFLRVDKDSAIHDRMWLIMVNNAFPIECAFMGALILTEPWLAYAILGGPLWDDILNLRRDSLSESALTVTILGFWKVLSSTNLECIHNLCREKGVYLFRRGKTKRRWSFTIIEGGALGPVRQVQNVEFKFQLEPFERILRLKDNFEDHLRNINVLGETFDAYTVRHAILKLFQLGCLGAILSIQVFSNLPWGPTAQEMSKRWAESGTFFYDFNFAREAARLVGGVMWADDGWVESAFDVEDVPAPDPTRKH
ncbi:hypothetical protein CcaverHIS641_0306460 [Cutaneotrichosporon cavernicola]|nr:hypothetical protein CcaverHIS641_0306460 [Cutaneotrichosporon cavernicola]